MRSILSVENLRYKDILKDITFSLKENSFNVLVGQNSSGKTTLIKSIIGLKKYEGKITFFDNLINSSNIDELRKDIGVLLDDDFLLSGTVFYNITYPLLNLNYKETELKKKAYEIASKLDIDNILIKNVESLSLSERKIVEFATAVIHNPKLIIIDCSFDELDNYYRNKIITYLKNQNKSTILLVTNNEEDILLAENLFIMNDGKIIECGKMKKMIKDEQIFIKNNIKLPFLVDLSHKLKSYELIDKLILNKDEMIEEIWK